MSALACIFPFLIFRSAAAAPADPQGVLTGQVPESLKLVVQEVTDFLNPHHSPSLNQTILSSFILLLTSIYVLRRTVLTKVGVSWLAYVVVAIYGLVSPDFTGFAAWRAVFTDFFYAVTYNRIFGVKDRKKGWTGAHIAFLRHGGFVLQDGDEPAKVLSFSDLVRLIKAGNIEQPDLSRKEVLARSIRPTLFRRLVSYISYLPLYWFIKKFAAKLPLLIVFVVLHALLTWRTALLHASSTIDVKEPFVVVQKTLEFKEMSTSGEDNSRSEEVPPGALTDIGKEEKVDELVLLIAEKAERDISQGNAQPDEPRRARAVRLLALPFTLSLEIAGALWVALIFVYSSSTVSLKYQCVIIGKPFNLLTAGDYTAILLENFLAWIGFARLSLILPFDGERKIWIVASHFLLLQPLALLLVRPQRIRTKVKEGVRQIIYSLYSLIYAAARLSILFTAMYSIKKVL